MYHSKVIRLAGEEPQERLALPGDVVADRPAQHCLAGLDRIEDQTLRDRTLEVELHLAVDVRQYRTTVRELDVDRRLVHGSGSFQPLRHS